MNRKKILGAVGIILSCVYLFIDLNAATVGYVLYRRLVRLSAVYFAALLINISTVYFQSMSQNRILTPSLLGFERLYLLIHVVIVFFVKHHVPQTVVFIIVVVSMCGVSYLIYTFILRVLKHDLFILLLVGTILSTLFSSLTSSLQMMMDPNEFSIIQNRSFASFNSINVNVLGISIVLSLVGFRILHRLKGKVDVIALGDHHAMNLGVDVADFHYWALIMIAMFTALTTALIGPISFLGLLSTNIARESVREYQAQVLIRYGTLISIVLLIAAQLIFERVLHFQTSISVVISIIGGVYFIHLMLKERFV